MKTALRDPPPSHPLQALDDVIHALLVQTLPPHAEGQNGPEDAKDMSPKRGWGRVRGGCGAGGGGCQRTHPHRCDGGACRFTKVLGRKVQPHLLSEALPEKVREKQLERERASSQHQSAVEQRSKCQAESAQVLWGGVRRLCRCQATTCCKRGHMGCETYAGSPAGAQMQANTPRPSLILAAQQR